MPFQAPKQHNRVVTALSSAVRKGTGPLARLIRTGELHCVFQPLGDLRTGAIFAHEALIRGPENTPLHSPEALLAMARSADSV